MNDRPDRPPEGRPAARRHMEKRPDGIPLATVRPAGWPAVLGAILLSFAVVGGPDGFYAFLRWAITATAVWTAVIAGAQRRPAWAVVLSVVAVLFNPFVPFCSGRPCWLPVDIAALVLFISAGVMLKASRPAPRPSRGPDAPLRGPYRRS